MGTNDGNDQLRKNEIGGVEFQILSEGARKEEWS